MKGLLQTRNIFLGIVVLGLLGTAARNVVDPDIWWHLKTGEYIAASKSVPHTDLFSYTRAGQPWVAHEWLCDLLIYGLYHAAGWGGLIVVFAAIVCAAFFLLYRRCAEDPYVSGVLVLFGGWTTAPLWGWGARPQIVSFFFTSLWLLLLERSERDLKLLWWTLPLTLLWVNLHAGFALGLVLLVLFLAGEFLEHVLAAAPKSIFPSRLRAIAITLLLDLLLVPLNPNGATMYRYPFETLRSHAMQSFIAEWASPNFHSSNYSPFFLLVLATVAALAWSRIRVRPRDMVLLLVSLFAALTSIRMIPLFVLVGLPILSGSVKEWAGPIRPSPRAPAAVFLNAVILVAMAGFVGFRIAQVVHRQPDAEAEHFPAAAVAYLQAHGIRGPIFNHYDWGGYLVWKLYPDTRVFIDGRADLYGDLLLQDFVNTYFQADWQQTVTRWQIQTVIVPPDSALATVLRSAKGWSVRYEDPRAVIFSTPESAATGP